MTETELRKTYADILNGYSCIKYNSVSLFIKHFSAKDQGIVDDRYLYYKDKAILNCLPSQDKRIEELLREGLWCIDDDHWITNQTSYLGNLEDTRRMQMHQSQMEEVMKTIKEVRDSLEEKLLRKRLLIGSTAEIWAERKSNDYYVYLSLFRDSSLNSLFFSEIEYDDLDGAELNEVITLYNDSVGKINTDVVKAIALSNFFQNNFALCEDNIHDFFGKPICHLSYHQSELATYGRYFRHILSEKNVPQEARKDPDRLINWYNGTKNKEKVMNDGASVVKGLVGAKAQDDTESSSVNKNLVAKAKEKGGKLGAQDTMKMLMGL